MIRRVLLLLAVVTCVRAAVAQYEPAWLKELDRRHDALIAANGPGTDVTLRDRLLEMSRKDQAARGFVNGQPKPGGAQVAANIAEIDAGLTAELKEIVKARGWPTVALVGIDASNAAATILIHTADHAWQRQMLPQLEALANAEKIDGSSVALATDKKLVSEGRLQRYGTQFKFEEDGTMAMYAVEDPAGLDARRAAVFLPPMAEYKKMLAEMFRKNVTERIVSAAVVR